LQNNIFQDAWCGLRRACWQAAVLVSMDVK
jgi:hypothetical protein